MYVIADVEWVENAQKKASPTQISAVRVDENWEIIDDFSEFVRPMNASFHMWDHIAYTGGEPINFLEASSCSAVFSRFVKWVGDDVICWWHESSKEMFSFIYHVVLRRDELKEPIILGDYLLGFLGCDRRVRDGAYGLARKQKIKVPKVMHNSWNDVIAVLNLAKGIGFPQEELLLPPRKPTPSPKEEKPHKRPNCDLRYQYDADSGLVHQKDCALLPSEGNIFGYATLNKVISYGYKACSCVSAELWKVRREMIADEISRTEYNYIFLPNSLVFHRRDCKMVYNSLRILGSIKYYTALQKGRTPCKICNPKPEDEFLRSANIQKNIKAIEDDRIRSQRLKREEAVAVKRHEQARKERLSALNKDGMTEQERNDFFTLTQTRFAFFASRGYGNFHTRSCYRLDGMVNIVGFDTFAHATSAGYTPCKVCKPTKKQDIVASIPFGNKVRAEESLEDLQNLARQFGYENKLENDELLVSTPVGKWKICLSKRPVFLKHLNLAKKTEGTEYHKQPRMFLSLIDALNYIHRHDSSIVNRLAEGLSGDVDDADDDDLG